MNLVCLGINAWKEFMCCCCWQLGQISSVVYVFYILIDTLFTCSMNCWDSCWTLPTLILDLSIFAVLSVFASCILKLCYQMCKHLEYLCSLCELTSLLWNDPLSLVIFFAVKSTLSSINRAIPAFFWWVLAWFIFFHPLTF